MSFSKFWLIPTPSSLILASSCSSLSSNCLHSNLDALTVARNFSGPQADREALLLAGADETFFFLVAAFFIDLLVKEHWLHASCSEVVVSKISTQCGERNVTKVLKWLLQNSLGVE